MKLVLIGIPGSGKSTQGNLLSKQLGIPYLSTGHIFRKLAREISSLGRYVKDTINAGLLIPDDKTIEIVKSYLAKPEYKKGYILDGFPRTIKQAKEFKNEFNRVIYLELPDKEVLWRLAYRNDALRSDDTVATIRKRIDIFHSTTKPVIDYFTSLHKLEIVDGIGSIEAVNKNILQSLGMELFHNKVRSAKHDKKAIIAIVGLAGSGKTQAASYFSERNIPVISFGKTVDNYVDKLFGKHTNNTHAKARTDIRNKHGMDALVKLNEQQIQTALDKHSVIIIDGLRSWQEYEYLLQKYTSVRIVLIALHANGDVRYKRIASRKNNTKLKGRERDIGEIFDTQMGPTIALSDYVVVNDGTIDDLQRKLETIYKEVQFS